MELTMSDLKSKLPDLKELTGMAGKLFGDVKKSVVEIIGTYKEKHKDAPVETKTETKPPEASKAPPPAPVQEPEQEAAPAQEEEPVQEPEQEAAPAQEEEPVQEEPPEQTNIPSDEEPPKQEGE
jgi:hypothetical protein